MNKEIKDIKNRITYLKWKIQFLTDQKEIKIDKYTIKYLENKLIKIEGILNNEINDR